MKTLSVTQPADISNSAVLNTLWPRYATIFRRINVPTPADILNLAAKGRLIQGNHDTVLLVRKSTAAISRRFLPIGASIWYHYFDGSWWLGKLSNLPAPPDVTLCDSLTIQVPP